MRFAENFSREYIKKKKKFLGDGLKERGKKEEKGDSVTHTHTRHEGKAKVPFELRRHV